SPRAAFRWFLWLAHTPVWGAPKLDLHRVPSAGTAFRQAFLWPACTKGPRGSTPACPSPAARRSGYLPRRASCQLRVHVVAQPADRLGRDAAEAGHVERHRSPPVMIARVEIAEHAAREVGEGHAVAAVA